MYKNTFFNYDNNTYYVDASGIMAVGWKKINGYWYYFRSWGGMYKNCTKTISKETCSFDSDGIFYKSVLTLNRKQQEKDNWCWAASAQMVGLYKNPSSTVTQTDIVKKVYGTDVNLGGNHKDVITGINCMTGLSCSVNGQIDSSLFESNILIKNNPCVLYINWTGNALKLKGHYVVARGYNKWGDTVNVVDPAKGCTNLNDWISHADLTGPCKFQSGTGYYENTITIN